MINFAAGEWSEQGRFLNKPPFVPTRRWAGLDATIPLGVKGIRRTPDTEPDPCQLTHWGKIKE